MLPSVQNTRQERKGREGKGREGNGREGKGREGGGEGINQMEQGLVAVKRLILTGFCEYLPRYKFYPFLPVNTERLRIMADLPRHCQSL
jgi:hypothetical protein